MSKVFWYTAGPMPVHFQEKDITIATGSECTWRRRLPSMGALRHDNAVPLSVQTIDSMNLEVLQHPPYSSDLAPSDFHLLGRLEEALRGRKIYSVDDAKAMCKNGLRPNNAHFILMELRHLWTVGSYWLKNRGITQKSCSRTSHLSFTSLFRLLWLIW
jgi:hypothetical protein